VSTDSFEPAVEPIFEPEAAVEPRRTVAPRPKPSSQRVRRRRTKLSIGLFLATCVSTFLTGLHPGAIGGILKGVLDAEVYPLWVLTGDWGAVVLAKELLRFRGVPPGLPILDILRDGLTYCGCLMGILLAHEMGHYLQAVRHRVPATLPFFIPFPITPFGTMGAVILQDAGRADRRKLFDIAVSGPLAGLVVAIPVLWYGVSTSRLATFSPEFGGLHYGDPLLIRWIVEAIHGPYGPNQDVLINAPLFAGWVGIFITALNLLPVGQLDGGHILYALVGRKAHFVAYAVLGAGVAWMAYSQRMHFILILLLLLVFGPKHPPTADDSVPLGAGRILLGWITLAFIVIGFTPTPIMI